MKKLYIFINILLVLFLANTTRAQEKVKYNLSPEESRIWFDGTSTLHDFTCKSYNFMALFEVSGSNDSILQLSDFELKVTVPVKEIESGNQSMDENMFEALKESEHPNIVYTLKKIESAAIPDSGLGWYQLQSEGELEVAGVKKIISMELQAFESIDRLVSFKGSVELDMTEYDVEPPSVMFGAINTGKDIVVHYELKFKK